MKVGVLALQGDSDAHRSALGRLGVESTAVRTPRQLADVDRLIIPGGESTAISRLLESNEMVAPLTERLAASMPILGTCAGMILLAREVLDGRPDQVSFEMIDLTVRRNGFGRQLDSFEADLAVTGFDAPFHGVFIRAPKVERVGPGVEVLARVDDTPVLCRAGSILVAAFHPELTADLRIHELFCELDT